MLYTRLIEKYSKEKMLSFLPFFYALVTLLFAALMLYFQSPGSEVTTTSFALTKTVGYLFYVFVESFGSLVVALFWAFTTSITESSSAKKKFPLIVAMGQMGGILLPYSIGGLPHRLSLTTDALSLFCLSFFIFLITSLVKSFLSSYHKPTTKEDASKHARKNPVF